MQKISLKALTLILSIGFSLEVFQANAAFMGPEAKSEITIKEIIQHHYDDMKVDVKGYIVKRLSHDKYLFKDGTGEIIVEIDDKYMPAENITPKTLIRIFGKIDIKYRLSNRLEIDAHRVEIIQ